MLGTALFGLWTGVFVGVVVWARLAMLRWPCAIAVAFAAAAAGSALEVVLGRLLAGAPSELQSLAVGLPVSIIVVLLSVGLGRRQRQP